MKRIEITQGRRAALAVLILLTVVTAAVCVRLAYGPVDAPLLQPLVRSALERQVGGGRAGVGRVRLHWTGPAHSLGLELDDVSLFDRRNRPVLRARSVEGGLALDGLGGFTLAPGVLRARDFFVAMSVSPKGRYALGYDASGAPSEGKSTLTSDLLDLVGRARFGHRNSFIRTVALDNGRVALRGGGVAWTANLAALDFSKLGKTMTLRADVSIRDSSGGVATLAGAGTAAVGLRNARLWGSLDGLSPAHVFPAVGATETLSRLDAVVAGTGAISYDLRDGIRAADVTLQAGKGGYRLDTRVEPFQSANVIARFAPQTGTVEISSLKVLAERTRLDLTGSLSLRPEDLRRHLPAYVDFRMAGQNLLESLNTDEPPQDIGALDLAARFTPEAKRLELRHLEALLAGARVSAAGVIRRDDQDRLGVKLRARVDGAVSPPAIFAFWPKSVATPVRDYLRKAILSGQVTNTAFLFNASPGDLSGPVVKDPVFRISFDFADTAMRFADGVTPITSAAGHALVQGNRFDLALRSGRMEGVAISEGSVEIPQFKPDGGVGHFRGRAVGEAREILTLLDRPPLSLFTKNGFLPSRTAGAADIRFEVDRPMLFEVPAEQYKVRFNGVVHKGGVSQAVLGWDLTDAELKVAGDEQKVELEGRGVVGPYRGGLTFATRYQGRGDKGMNVTADGAVDAGVLGGRTGALAPFAGKFRAERGDGAGLIHSSVFDGRIDWKDGMGPDRVVLSGWTLATGLRRIGTPLTAGLPDRFATTLHLARARDVWRGPLRADAASGQVTYAALGPRSRVIYQSEIGPVQARRLGLASLPLFAQPRQVLVDALWQGAQGAAQVHAGPVAFSLTWDDTNARSGQRRAGADLTAQDLPLLGFPSALARPGQTLSVQASWRDLPAGMTGQASIDGTSVTFQTGSGRNGAVNYAVQAELDRSAMRRWGLPELLDVDGTAALTARWASIQNRASAGRVDIDLSRTTLSVADSDWKKPGGQPARLSVDFIDDGQGSLRLSRISGQSAGADLEGVAVLGTGGRLISLEFSRARLNGLIDATARLTRDPAGYNLVLRGKWLDARRVLDEAGHPPPASRPGVGATEPQPLRLDATLEGLRLSDEAVLRNAHVNGVWGAQVASRRFDLTAYGVAGSRITGRLAPSGGFSAIQAQAANAGDAARTLFGFPSLSGGVAKISGKLVEGGADLDIQMSNVRLVKAPAMAQILTMASFRGLADTLNGEGVMFNTIEAPLQIRGPRLTIQGARATGSALGLTTRGVANLDTQTLDFQGTIAPAYALNAAIGHVPVIGQLLTSRKGEGVVGLGYAARGTFAKPQISVNPLSVLTPGILRRMFETPTAPAPAPAHPEARARPGD